MNRTAILLACACSFLAMAGLQARAEIQLPDAPAPAPAPKPVTPPAPAPKAAVPFSDRMLLGNKDVFHGDFLGFSEAGGVVWKHQDSEASFTLKPANLDRIELNQTTPRSEPGDILVRFNNGDTLVGRLTEYTPEQTTVETWFAGKMSFKSDTIRSLSPSGGNPDFLIQGFGKPTDWKTFNGNPGDVKIADDKLSVNNNSGAARELPFPAKFKLDMDLPQSANRAPFIGILAEQPDRNSNCYAIQINNNYVSVSRMSQNGGGRGMNNFQFVNNKRTVHLSICGDADAKTLYFYINDKLAGTVTDGAAFPKGKHLCLTGWNGEQKFSNLALSAWGGPSDTVGGVPAMPEKDSATLGNKDQVSGKLLAIRGGKASFQTEFATMEIPLERVKRMDLSKLSNRSPKPANNDILFCFNNTDHLTVHLGTIKDGKAAVNSETFGNFTLDLNAAKKLLFNLNAPFRTKAGDEADEEEGDEGQPKAAFLRGNRVQQLQLNQAQVQVVAD